jgi:hypothetical protein
MTGKEKTLITIAILVFVIPVLGLPRSWHPTLFVLLGLSIVITTVMIVSERRMVEGYVEKMKQRAVPKTMPLFSEETKVAPRVEEPVVVAEEAPVPEVVSPEEFISLARGDQKVS